MPRNADIERFIDLAEKRQRLIDEYWRYPENSNARLTVHRTLEAVQSDIDRLGITEEQLQRFVRTTAPASPGSYQMAKGFGCLALAGLATLVTWLVARDSGGTYYVFWGGMAYGAWLILRGLLDRISS